MTCRPKSETAENEARMQQTLAAYRTKKIYKHFCNCHSSPSFMYHTQKSSQWSFFTPRKPPKLSSSHLYRRTRVRSMNIKVDNHRIYSFSFINQTNDRINTKPSRLINDKILIEYSSLGKDWISNFLLRYPHCKTIVEKRIESTWIQNTLSEMLQKWFDAFRKKVLEDLEVLLKNVYNMNESHFSIGTIKTECVIINARIRVKLQIQSDRQKRNDNHWMYLFWWDYDFVVSYFQRREFEFSMNFCRCC